MILHFRSTIKLPPMPIELQVISCVLFRDKVYVTGAAKVDADINNDAGKDDKSFQVQVYSLVEAEWSTLPKAQNYNATVAVINERITLVGGRDVKTRKITDIQSTWFEEEHQWGTMRMHASPFRLESGICQHDNLLLVTGGVIDGVEKQTTTVVKMVNVYNHSTKDWVTPKALELPKALRSHHMVVFKENIYIIGGAFVHPLEDSGTHKFNQNAWRAQWSDVKEVVQQPSRHVENMWKAIKAPPILRPTVVAYKGFLLSIGGVLGGEPQKEIHMFVDEVDNHWIKLGEMKVGRYRHGVVPGPVQSCGITLFIVGGYVRSPPDGDEDNVKTSSTEIVSL